MNALVGSMTAADLAVSGGAVLQVGQPYLAGAFQAFDVEVQIGDPNTPCWMQVPPGAFTGAAGCGRQKRAACACMSPCQRFHTLQLNVAVCTHSPAHSHMLSLVRSLAPSIAHSHIHAWLLRLLAPLLAADSQGVVSEGSNTIVAVWDTQAPQPTIQAVGTSYSSTDETKVTLYLSFGERVLQLNPLRLFTVTGLSR